MLTHVMMAEGHFNAIRIYVTYVHEVIHLVSNITGCKFCKHN